MDRSRDWLAPLTGVGFFVLGIVSFLIMGEPKSADDPIADVVNWYLDNKDSVQIGAIIGVGSGVLLIFFGAYLRKVLRAAGGEADVLSLVSFIGLVLVALGFAIDGTIAFALAEAADEVRVLGSPDGQISPITIQALQALWDNDFLPIMLGVLAFLWATGLAVVRTGVLPKWLGWVMIALGILGVTPIGFVSFIGAAILVLVISILLSLRLRSGSATPERYSTP
jgi:Domain of unknown function (DUF4386)